MSDNAVDKLAMLLSTDWFEPLWSLIGLDVAAAQRSCVKGQCRDIVRNFMGDVDDYYCISFADERLRATRASLLRSFEECKLPSRALSVLGPLCEDHAHRNESEKTAWLFQMTADELLADASLPPAIHTAISNAGVDFDPQLGEQFLASRTEWDVWIQGLMPELPTALSDWVSVGILPVNALKKMLSQLDQGQQELFIARTRAAAERLTGLSKSQLPNKWK